MTVSFRKWKSEKKLSDMSNNNLKVGEEKILKIFCVWKVTNSGSKAVWNRDGVKIHSFAPPPEMKV